MSLDLSGFENAFPGMLAKFPVVRDRDYYRPPKRASKKKGQQQLLAGGGAGASGDGAAAPQAATFWEAVSETLKRTVGPDWEPQAKLALLQLYHEHVFSLNLEEVEELAEALAAIEKQKAAEQAAEAEVAAKSSAV